MKVSEGVVTVEEVVAVGKQVGCENLGFALSMNKAVVITTLD